MTPEIAIVLTLVFVAVVLFASERFPVDLVALIVMATLLLSGIISPQEGIAGFSNTATITVGAMFILSAAVYRTGAINFVGSLMARAGRRSLWLALAAMMLALAVMSAFINNTATLAIFLPIVLGVSRDLKVSPSRMLMPLSFAAQFGGVCTLIGTSTNILVSSIAEARGLPPVRMFEPAALGLVLLAVGLVYMLTIGIRLIPERRSAGDLRETYGMGDYLTEIVLLPQAKSVGKTIRQCPLVTELGVEVLEVVRKGSRRPNPRGDTVLKALDVLRVRADVEKIRKLQEREGIELTAEVHLKDEDGEESEAEETMLVEAALAPNSMLEGKTLKSIRFRDVFGAVVLAIRHRGKLQREHTETTRLSAGDALLLQVSGESLGRIKRHPAFLLVSEVGLPEFRRRKTALALAIVAAVVGSAALGLLSIVVSAIAGGVLMVLTGCITLEEAYESIQWKVIFLLAGVLTLGVALDKTGAALLLSNALLSTVGAWGPVALVGVFYLLTSLLTEAMSNNATAALLAPIAIATSETLGIDSRPLLMAVMFAASTSFMTPVGYQTNTMIYGPGQYRFTDFVKVGGPLNLLFFLLATLLIPRIWPF